MNPEENRRRSFAIPLILGALLAGAALLCAVMSRVDCPFCASDSEPRRFSLNCSGCAGAGSVRLYQSWRLKRLISQP
jgi:hypothetical protein